MMPLQVSPRPFRWSLAPLALVGLLFSPALARGQEATSEAKGKAEAKVAEARQLYERGDYQAALSTLEAAYALYPSPKLHFNLGVVQRGLGRNVEALDSFELFLADGGGTPERRAEAQAQVSQLHEKVAFVDLVSDVAGAEVFVDGRGYGKTPVAAPIAVMPGPHQILVQKEHAPLAFTDRVEASAGALVRIQVRLAGVSETIAARSALVAPVATVASLPPAPPPSSPPPSRPRWTPMRKLSLGLGVLGVAGLATGGFFSWRVSAIESELAENSAKREGQLPHDYTSKKAAGQLYDHWQWPAYLTGAGLLAGAVTCLLVESVGERDGRTRTAFVAVPALSPQGGGVTLRARF
jgi:hypothetical protein